MVRKQLSVLLIALLVFLAAGGQVFAQDSRKTQVSPVEKIKAKIAKLSAGKKTRAQITLQTGEKIKGYVSSAGENDFVFTEKKTGQTKTISYLDVAEVKKSGGLSTAAKIGIGLGIGVAVLAVVAIHIKNHLFDDFNLGPR
jgi:hypothetical protein